MAETAATEGAAGAENEGTEGTESTPSTEESKTFSETYVKQLRGEAASYRRELREAQERLQGLEDAGKTEVEKLAERVAQAEAGLASASSEAARLRVAMSKGLTETQAKRLVGSTVEELEADAEELLKAFGASEGNGEEQDGQGPSGGTPRERLTPGAAPMAEPEETDPGKLAEQVRRPFQ